MPKPLELIENRRDMAMCETTPRYDVMHYGRKIGQLYFNTRGYQGCSLPAPEGPSHNLGEKPISKYRGLVAILNRQWMAHDREVAAIDDPPPEDTPSLEDRGIFRPDYSS